ncbi:STAS domain-containing protein [Cryptosporangium minutisporangium]|uniref:STAS domain-containing protein n=1 Tax=Cryptosporangium minutisporangium TaxID=113569 RepID=A0ABP6SRJ1_9ACTN
MANHPAAARDPEHRQLLSITPRSGRLPGCAVLDVVGRVDRSTVPLLQVCLQTQLGRADVQELIVDLRRVTEFSTAASDALIRCHRLSRLRGIRLIVRPVRRPSLRGSQAG